MSVLCILLQVINEVKVTHQGEGHIKVKVKYLYPFKFYVAHTFWKRVVCIRLNAFLLIIFLIFIMFQGSFSENLQFLLEALKSGTKIILNITDN